MMLDAALVGQLALGERVQEVGAYAGLAAVLGLAVLSLLYFAQAREVKRLREWAGRAPERDAELAARVQQAAQARSGAVTRVPATAAPAAAGGTAGPGEATELVRPPAAVPAAGGPAKPATAAARAGAPAAPPAGAPGSGAGPETPGEGARAPGDPARPGVPASAPGTPASGPGAPASAPGTPAPGPGAPASAPGGDPATPGAPAAPGDRQPAQGAPAPGPGGAAPAPGGAPAPAAAPKGPAPGDAREDDVANGAAARPPGAPPVPAAPAAATPAGAARAGNGAPRPAPLQVPPGRPPSSPPPPAARRGLGRSVVLPVVVALAAVAVIVVVATQLLGGGEGRESAGNTLVRPAPDPGRTPTTGDQTLDRSAVSVAVYNGTTFNGLAREASTALEQRGYEVPVTQTDTSDQTRQVTEVFYADGRRRWALDVAEALDVPAAQIKPMNQDATVLAGDSGVLVLVGADKAQ